MNVKLIGAMDAERGTGRDGSIPWRCPGDLRHFKNLTMGGAVVVGRRTAETLPPLPGRHVITMSRTLEHEMVAATAHEAILLAESLGVETCWFAGGAEVWRAGLPYATMLHLSCISGKYDCDTFFPLDDALARPAERGLFWRNGFVELIFNFHTRNLTWPSALR